MSLRRSQSFNVGSHAAGGPGAKKEKVQDPPVEHDLLVTLEDICKGVTKRMKISRRVVGNDGSVRKEEKVRRPNYFFAILFLTRPVCAIRCSQST